MEEFIASVSNSDTRLIVVLSPKYGTVSSGAFEQVGILCDKYGVEFWDYYSDSTFQDMEYFKEPMHLDERGAYVFTRCLSEKMR